MKTKDSIFQELEVLKSANCPKGYKIDLSFRDIFGDKLIAITNTLTSGICPEELNINLSHNLCDDPDIKIVAEAIASGKCPKGLNISLAGNEFSHNGLKAIADALASGKCPEALNIDLSYNEIDSRGAKIIAFALASNNCPAMLNINLSNNKIRPEGIKAINEAMMSNLTTTFTNTFLCEHPINDILKKLNTRNLLIREYPEFINHIKSAFFKYKLFEVKFESLQPKSLKESAARLALSKGLFSTSPGIDNEVNEYINRLDKLEKQIQMLFPDYSPIKQKRSLSVGMLTRSCRSRIGKQ